MTPREIIAEAWAITCTVKPLRRWGFFSSLFETLLDVKLISYQAYFMYEWFRGQEGGFFDVEILIYDRLPHWFFWTFVITFIVLFVVELFIPTLAKGAIIGLGAKAYQKEEAKGGLVLALYNFFPIFALHELFVLSSLATTVTVCSLIVRYISSDLKFYMIMITVSIWLLSNLLGFFASFAEPAIVIRRVGIFEALGQSFKLIVSYLGHVMFLWLLLFVITIRIMINTLLVIAIPALAVGVGFLLTFILSPMISYAIATLIGFALIFVTSYFFAYLHVFKETVWTLTYLELKKQKDLVMIEA